MSTLAVPGAHLYYETRGSGPVLLLIPGANGVARVFPPLAERLSRHHTVVTCDRRGFSRSRLDGPQELLTARRYGSPLLEDGGCFVRLVVARVVEAQDAVARALGLEPDAGEAVPVGRTPVRPLDLLSRVCRVHPQLARQAMGLLAPLGACAKTAGTKPGRAATQLQVSLKKLTAPHPELLPYALDEGARIVAAAGSVAMARPLHVEARAAEKRLGGIDEGALRILRHPPRDRTNAVTDTWSSTSS